MRYYITYIITEKLPEKNYKQISFLTATDESYTLGISYYGYNGSRKLTELELSEEIKDGKIIRLARPLIVDSEVYLWIDSLGKIWSSSDNLFKEQKKDLGPSGIKPKSVSKTIFEEKFKKPLSKVQNRTSLII